ncbi:hypothetical protein QAD02_016879 [Eretmocerus hayati]|uniref:Uncharacterized protein n=1 Tax=Eretmocerus hayati TaxID=131215 RepID=A0ACC2PCD4_9HYME|nr:hypothetical protein QAD02_016879 [Eretmocerus hayati]
MKLLTSGLLFAAVCMSVVTSVPVDESDEDSSVSFPEIEEFIHYWEVCENKTEISPDEIWISPVIQVIYPGHCMTSCVWQEIGLADEKGKIIKEEMMEGLRNTLTELPMLDHTTKKFISEPRHVHRCIDHANMNKNNCDVVGTFFECMIRDLMNFKDMMRCNEVIPNSVGGVKNRNKYNYAHLLRR